MRLPRIEKSHFYLSDGPERRIEYTVGWEWGHTEGKGKEKACENTNSHRYPIIKRAKEKNP